MNFPESERRETPAVSGCIFGTVPSQSIAYCGRAKSKPRSTQSTIASSCTTAMWPSA
jgi:hypothetical protein